MSRRLASEAVTTPEYAESESERPEGGLVDALMRASISQGSMVPVDDKPLPIRKARLEETRKAILQSALEIFSELGFDGASTRAVAAKAGVNHGMIRHIYGSKEELWQTAIAFMFDRAHAAMARDFSGLTLRQRFEARTRLYVRYCAEHPEHARLMIQLSTVSGPKLAPAIEQFSRTRHRDTLNDIRLLKAEGLLPNVDSASLLLSYVAACQMIYILAPEVKANSGRDVFEPAAVERHADAVLALFVR
jgi:TetR/AcrR family transcriptional regulator